MTDYVSVGGLRVAKPLYALVSEAITPGTGIDPTTAWHLLDDVVHELGPRNQALLDRRDELQTKIDAWLGERRAKGIDTGIDGAAHRAFLEDIGYLVPEGPSFEVSTANVDPEIAVLAGPQLVVPVDKARYALNAANARWGSLYDALYGTDAIPETGGAEQGSSYNPKRGERVIDWANAFLDQSVPLAEGRWGDVTGFSVDGATLELARTGGGSTHPADAETFVGYRGEPGSPTSILLRNNGLHVDLEVDSAHPIGRQQARHH